MWPSGYVRAFKIPKKIDTFLFSPFNESYHPSYMFDDFKVTIGPHEGAIKLKKIADPIGRLSLNEFANQMSETEKKAISMWGKNINKILILYDNRNLKNPEDNQRVFACDELSKIVFSHWHLIQVNDPMQSDPSWCHYTEPAIRSVYKQITEIEPP